MEQQKQILFEAREIYNKYGAGTNFEKDLAEQGMPLINRGRYKVVFAFKNYAVAIIPYERVFNFVTQVQQLYELKVDRNLFVYPLGIIGNPEHEQIFVLYELCEKRDVCDMVSYSQNYPVGEQQVVQAAQSFTNVNFLRQLFSELRRLHNYKNDDKGIFNFDIKFENLFKCVSNPQVKLGDIDGYGSVGESFGVVTHSDAISIFGLNGYNGPERARLDKRLGMLNDIFNVAFMFFFFKFYLIEKKLGIAYVNTMRHRASGENDDGFFYQEKNNVVEQKKSLFQSFYKDVYDRRNQLEYNKEYVTLRIRLFWRVTKKILQIFTKQGKLSEGLYDKIKNSIVGIAEKRFSPVLEFTKAYDAFVDSLLQFEFNLNYERSMKRRKLRVERVPLKRVKSYQPLRF